MRKDVVRLLLKLGVLFAICAVLLVAVNHFYTRSKGYQAFNSTDGLGRLKSAPSSLTVVNVGSSHGQYDFNYSGIAGVSGYNLALKSQDFYYDLKVLEKAAPDLAPDCTVLIPISYFSLSQGERDLKAMNIDARYGQALDYGSIRHGNAIDFIKQRYFPVLFSGAELRYMIGGSPAPGPWAAQKTMSSDQLMRDSIVAARRHKQLMTSADYDRNRELVGDLVRYCRSKGLRPVFVTTPFTSFYNGRFSWGKLIEQRARIWKIATEYGVPYLDYSRDPRFSSNAAYFQDSDHLNEAGSRAFTATVIKDLKARQILGRPAQ
jgi:hypothetical protein